MIEVVKPSMIPVYYPEKLSQTKSVSSKNIAYIERKSLRNPHDEKVRQLKSSKD
jgi:hypothetical protein